MDKLRCRTSGGELVRLSRFWTQANILTELLVGGEGRGQEPKERRWGSWMKRAALMAMGAVVVSVVLAI